MPAEPTELFLVNRYGDTWEKFFSRRELEKVLRQHPNATVRRSPLTFEDVDTSALVVDSGPWVYRFRIYGYLMNGQPMKIIRQPGVYEVVLTNGGWRAHEAARLWVREKYYPSGYPLFGVPHPGEGRKSPWGSLETSLVKLRDAKAFGPVGSVREVQPLLTRVNLRKVSQGARAR